ncbi:50S ribosomal protein L18 [Candidatus Bathyarchaeota archaeon]|nr:50S ribosomal protein L18 [Candidatus Bathyarchaeota archaeon]NIU81029.1 50S ribosomal protein L18 [Candidatus Bathyarchaeota archaeon]NIV67687.1 50S ribosomal protein L18 [Candidatus Bathyarchaeota archaeon]NIW16672.1 50S ribosomal protein L18 [Candidatus Bathyarchaeota archaeon]NIW34886.1 50S ribosomal protein L18 [Candidatus Bathyarchaeota archaeon]
MAKGPAYNVPFRRRRKGKTDYESRRALVLSRLPRLVIRGTSKHLIVQVIEAEVEGDRVVASANSRELREKFGFQGGCGNLPAAYMTGLLCGYRAASSGVEEMILDLGLQTPSKGARVFAALKGVLEAGVMIPHKSEVLPEESRISGQHIVDYANQLSSDPDLYQRRFSGYLSRGLRPEDLSEHFSSIKEKIVSSFEEEGL